MKKTLYFSAMMIILISLALTTSCNKKKDMESIIPQNDYTQTAEPTTEQDPPKPQDTTVDEANVESQIKENEQIIHGVTADVNGDNKDEKIEIVQVSILPQDQNGSGELEGKVRITSGSTVKEATFIKKPQGLTGIMSDVEILDIDGDGVKDVFITTSEAGSPFTLNYFFIYNYKTDESFSFNVDNKLTFFAKGFKFKYVGKGILDILNDSYNFKAEINLINDSGYSSSDETSNEQYSRSWVEPVPSEIGQDSRLSLVEKDGSIEIKVPLPVYGAATSDLIGELDLYYCANKDFVPEMRRFEVFSFTNGAKEKIGEGVIK